MPIRIGIDVGGVIIDRVHNDNSDTSMRGDNFMKTSAVKGVFDAVKELVKRYGVENVFIISKCGPVMQAKTEMWLDGNGFYDYTGFKLENLYFCLERDAKAPIAAMLQLTDFVDDRAEVLFHMTDIVERLYLFGPQPVSEQDTGSLILVEDWVETLDELPVSESEFAA